MFGVALFGQSPIQTCTVANIRGIPVAGNFCGGSTSAPGCTPGAVYSCNSGPAGTKNNCKLVQLCSTGCTQTLASKATAVCATGPTPLTVTPLSPTGGSDIDLSVNLAATHTGAIINLRIDRGDLIPGAFCAVPPLANQQTNAAFALSTAVVAAPAPVQVYTDVTYGNPAGQLTELVSRAQPVTLQPGGTEAAPPPISNLALTPNSIGPAGISFATVTLANKAPAGGVHITLGSSDPAVASIIQNGEPFVEGSCTVSHTAETIQAESSVPQPTTVTISASSGAPGQAPVTAPLAITNGCVPVACSGGPTCGPQSNGCGGVINCGCSTPGQTCGGGGSANVCGSGVPAPTALSFSPSTVPSGTPSTGTVTINVPAPAGGIVVSLSSTSTFVTVPPSVTVPAGQTMATFSATTTAFSAGTVSANITAGGSVTVSAILTVTASAPAACTPTTCAALGQTCGTASDGCGGTLTCGGACSTAPATVTVSATGKGGKVTSSPSGINVSSGNTTSAPFAAGTQVTLTTDDGHGAIWSGLCSSNGAAAQSCTFTVGASGSITANMQ